MQNGVGERIGVGRTHVVMIRQEPWRTGMVQMLSMRDDASWNGQEMHRT